MLPISRVDVEYVNNSKNAFRNVGFYKYHKKTYPHDDIDKFLLQDSSISG